MVATARPPRPREIGPPGNRSAVPGCHDPRRLCEPSQNGLLPLSPQAHQTTVVVFLSTIFNGVTSVPRWEPLQYG